MIHVYACPCHAWLRDSHEDETGGDDKIPAEHDQPHSVEARQPGGGQLIEWRHAPRRTLRHGDRAADCCARVSGWRIGAALLDFMPDS